MTRIATIIGKGPSAARATEWIASGPSTDLCTINEAALILPPTWPVRFAFFCHARYAESLRPLWERVETFVAPSVLVGDDQSLPADFPRHKLLRYIGNACGASRAELLERINLGQPAHHHSCTAAASFLAKLGYRRLRLIGFGGDGYAPGFAGQPTNMGDDWRAVEDTLAGLLAELYGCETERFGE